MYMYVLDKLVICPEISHRRVYKLCVIVSADVAAQFCTQESLDVCLEPIQDEFPSVLNKANLPTLTEDRLNAYCT